jgi:uncharacterized protein
MTFHVRNIGKHGLALDRAGGRRWYDEDGRLHYDVCNISKANVCVYLGNEIPDADRLGLNPEEGYFLLRDPDELAKAAPTFRNLPLLCKHVPVNAVDHHPELVVGATGSDAKFNSPYLQNSMVVWSAQSIDGVESGKRRELSSAYRYTVDMTSGRFEGVEFDGVMRNIVGNHVALIPDGRVGPDVALDGLPARRGFSAADAQSFAARFPHAARIKIAV